MTRPTDAPRSTEDDELSLSTETLEDLDPDSHSGEIKGGGKMCTGKLTSC